MCKKDQDGLTRKHRKIIRKNPEIRIASEAAGRKGVPERVIHEGIARFSFSGELPSWIGAGKKKKNDR